MSENTLICRCCNGSTKLQFRSQLLRKYDVGFYRCAACDSLQTEAPYWLSEAYDGNLADIDTGVAQRNLLNFRSSFWVAKLLGVKNIIDFGGGDGLTCRLLRDYGLNCYVSDKYAKPVYAIGFGTETLSTPDFPKPELLTAFEVVEHFEQPSTQFARLLECGASCLFISTGYYKGQSANWWYISQDSGQHVFFYSKKCLRDLGKIYGFHSYFLSGFTLYSKSAVPLRAAILWLLLRKEFSYISRSLIAFVKPKGVWRDYDRLKNASKK